MVKAKTTNEEEYFPRGRAATSHADVEVDESLEKGSKKISTKLKPGCTGKKEDKKLLNLFSNKENKKSKKGQKAKKKGDEKPKSVIKVKSVPALTYSKVKEGQVMLGVVNSVAEYELQVSLPGHMTGTVAITNISQDYTQRIRKLAEQDENIQDDDADDVPDLKSLYKVGDPVIVHVTSCTQDIIEEDENTERKGKFRLSLSLDPRDVMGGRIPVAGDLCVASFHSKEDHGYIMDVGNSSVRGFLPNKHVSKLPSSLVSIGSVTICQVSRKDGGALTLTCGLGKVLTSLHKSPNLHNIIPGTRFEAKVESHLENGLSVRFGGEDEAGIMGYVPMDALPGVTNNVKDISIGSAISVRLAYIIPTINTPVLMARDEWPLKAPIEGLKVGSVVESAEILQVTNSYVILKLNDQGTIGYVSEQQTRDGQGPKDAGSGEKHRNRLADRFKVGAKVKTRVIGLDMFTGVLVCTTKKSKLTGIASLEQLTLGDKITGTVKRFVEGGLEVTVGAGITGFVPIMYLSDVPLKHPEKKFLPGDKIKCRVHNVDLAKKQLRLISKPIIVREEFPVISSFHEAKIGTVTEGVVSKVTKSGLLINLFGDLRGWAPKSALSTEQIDLPEKLFFIGQAVKCQITECDPARKRISLSLLIGTMNPFGKKQKAIGSVLKIGQSYKCTVKKVSELGLDVTATCEGQSVDCTVPLHHLTDTASLATSILSTFKEGDELEAACFQLDVMPVLTIKPMLIESSKDPTLTQISSIEDVRTDMVFAAAVQSIKDFGIFARPLWQMQKAIFIPTRMIADFYVETGNDIVDIGQTLLVRVKDVDEPTGKMMGSTQLKEMDIINANSRMRVLLSYLKDSAKIHRKLRKGGLGVNKEALACYSVGDLVSVTVKEVTEVGVLSVTNTKHDQPVLALSPKSAMPAESSPSPGVALPAMVVFIDYQQCCLEISCDPELISSVAEPGKVPSDGTKVGGKIILTRSEHSLQMLWVTHPLQYAGHLVYLSTSQHMNDLVGDDIDEEHFNDKHGLVQVVIQASKGVKELVGLLQTHFNAFKRKDRKRMMPVKEKESPMGLKRRRTVSNSSVGSLLEAIQGEDEGAQEADPESADSPKKAQQQKGEKRSKDPAHETDDDSSQKEDDITADEPNSEKKKKKKRKRKNTNESKPAINMDELARSFGAASENKTDNNQSDALNADTKEPSNKMVTKASSVQGMSDPGWNFNLTSVTLPAWTRVSIWDDEDIAEDEKADSDDEGKKRLSKREARLKKKEETEKALEAEERIIQGQQAAPQSVQDCEKLVLATPDSSLAWIQYMAFHVQSCEYNLARAVAARAVQRIHFREENERLNVYLAWLNLENTYGNTEQLQKVLKEAAQRNDEFKVYCQMAAIYAQSGKTDEAERTYKTLVKKFSKEKEVWIRFGIFYYRINKHDEGRFVFTRSLQNLDKKDVVEVTSKFAQIEFRYGDVERGKTMFEKLLSNYPRRVDLWSTYADKLCRSGDITAARALYNRMSTLGLQAKKMKPLFAKWLEFEKVHGTEEQQNEVRKAALAFLHTKDLQQADGAEQPMETD